MKVNNNLLYRVALNLVLSEKLKLIKKVCSHFPFLEDIFRANISDLKALGVDEEKAKTLASPRLLDRAEKEIERIREKEYTILTIESEHYPEYLREIFDSPSVLYCGAMWTH